MGFKVIKPGLLSTMQDEGRYGFRKYGVIASGPMDLFAHRTANILVGNTADAAVLEITLQGPRMVAQTDMLLALCGAEMEACVEERKVPLWRSFLIRKGEQLNIGYAAKGCRAYLAVHGGFAAKVSMGSKSTYLRAGIGGHEGRALVAGDELNVSRASKIALNIGSLSVSGAVSAYICPNYEDNPVVNVVWGKEAELFTESAKRKFLSKSFMVTPQSDRMGYRLEGEPLASNGDIAYEMISEGVVQGTIQVPPGGQPILLLSDCQTTGGYPRIAHVITAHLPIIAQVKPGGKLRFREVSLREAQEQLLLQAMDLQLLEAGVLAWFKDHSGS
ncbi:5-oxoprolinase subunit C family protein [Paenibacillus planticolens]|uniref:5-oxoprolinase/urea amidolyase family protein n=1 Tax=Paenibacillus planticolens TaxID=2654976 RepID=A0ABX1ZJ65_9BACL|nr:biotin-dependent carboxyltransferase family protein [Paenibacillus planticolens]NOU99875.1 5-oxoprolinase/urea amidolyase family protein [Paenibacillus planticolens]